MAKSRGVVDIVSCVDWQNSRCSCLKKGQTCTRLCRCVNCNNACLGEKSPNGRQKGCTCGSMEKGKTAFVTCKDNDKRKSRCPCLRIGLKCNSSCRCYNCGNNKDCPIKRSSKVTSTKRKRRNPETYKRMRGADYLVEKGFVVSNGPWTNLESIILFVVTEVIEDSGVDKRCCHHASMRLPGLIWSFVAISKVRNAFNNYPFHFQVMGKPIYRPQYPQNRPSTK